MSESAVCILSKTVELLRILELATIVVQLFQTPLYGLVNIVALLNSREMQVRVSLFRRGSPSYHIHSSHLSTEVL